ncbi:MAG: hypothetical protein LCH30_07815 [Proteobacteria bacterium]|nr:hypothetical protein [Pseudomonadota bacterium]
MPFVFLLDKDQSGNMLTPKDPNTLVVCAGTIGDSVDGMGSGFNYFKNLFGFNNNPKPAWVATLNTELQKQKKYSSITPYIRLIEPTLGYYCGGVATVDMLTFGQAQPTCAQKVHYKQAVTSAMKDALALKRILYLQPLGIGIYGWEPKLAAQLFFESYNELKQKYPELGNLQIQIPIYDSSPASKDSIFKAELEALQKSEKIGMLMEGVEYNIKYKESNVNSEKLTDSLNIKATITFRQAKQIRGILYKYFIGKCDSKELSHIIKSNSSYAEDQEFKHTVSIFYPSGLLTEIELNSCLSDIRSFLELTKQPPMPTQHFITPSTHASSSISSPYLIQGGVIPSVSQWQPPIQNLSPSAQALGVNPVLYLPESAAPLAPQRQQLPKELIVQPPPGSQASQFQLGAVMPLDNLPPFDLLIAKEEGQLNENRQRISAKRKEAYDYFAKDAGKRDQSSCVDDVQKKGVRVYLDKGLSDKDKKTIKASCSRSSGYQISKDSRHLVKSRVIASQSYFVADASGNTFAEPVPAIMLTSCAPNLRSGENPGDVKAYCQPNGRLNAMAYKDEMKRVWTRFFYAANAEAEGQQVEVLTPLAGGGAYLRTLSEEDRLSAQQIIAQALIEAVNANSFPNIQSIHFFVVDTDKDRPYAHVEKVFLAHQANYKGKPINLSNADMLMAGQRLATQHRRIILCNPGSDHIPGGGAYADKDDLTKCPKKGGVGPFYGKVHAFEEQLAHYSCFLYAQNLEQNAYYDGNFEQLCKEIPADILGLKAVPSNASSSHPTAVAKAPLPLQSKSNSNLFPHVKFLGDKQKNGKQRHHNGTRCYEIECSVDDERNRLVDFLQQNGIKVLFNDHNRIKYAIKTTDGKRDAEDIVMEPAIELVVNKIASKCNDVDYWSTKVRSGYGVSSGNHKIPQAISQIQQIVKGYQQNRGDGTGLLKSIGELAVYKHSTYFQWAHSIFRGRDNQTNKFYSILAELKGGLKTADISKIIEDLDREFPMNNGLRNQP